MSKENTINVGIGFATGRKNFKKVLNTYIYSWKECGLIDVERVKLNLLIAYDLNYNNTEKSDFTNISNDLSKKVDNICFLDTSYVTNEINDLISNNVISEKEAALFFNFGYAAMRNTILYAAVKNNIDYLLYLDDDEYPFAVTKTRSTAIWSGQHVLATHLQHIRNADITNGYHCGYISPIPYIEFNDILTEDDFRMFIEAISNDIINWENVVRVMNNGGVTYADTDILQRNTVVEAEEVNNTKFISGANLCINLTDVKRVFPFYNPPGARGEDTFLSTCLSDRKVLRVPCYAFHNGFGTYNHLLSGVLPIELKKVKVDSKRIINRFYKACIGWVRYKPLLVYITQPNLYDEKIRQMRNNLNAMLPKICAFFDTNSFMQLEKELDAYDKNVKKHYKQFIETQNVWTKISEYLSV